MKKYMFLTLALLITAATGAWAEEFNYDFNDQTLQGWSVIKVKPNGGTWLPSSQNPAGYNYSTLGPDGSFCLSYSYIDYDGAYNTDNYLVSPQAYQINDEASMTFFLSFGNGAYPDYAEICIATTEDYPTAEDFVAIWTNEDYRGGTIGYTDWAEITVDLSAYAGQKVWIAYHHKDYDNYELWLDNITIDTGIKPYNITGETGKCFWSYNEEKKELTIWGDGAMANYSDAQDCPWYEFADDVETLIIKSGVTRIGHRAFYSMERLTFATIPNTVETIGNYAFYSCTRLPFISIPASVTDMGRDIFWHCYEMKNAYVYADVNVLTWTDTDCDDFTLNRNTKCHVTDADAWNEKFGESVNVTFVGDLKPVPAAYANEDAFELNEGENDHGKIVFYADGVVATKAKAGAAVMVIVKPIKGYIAELVYGTGYSSWEQAQSRMKKAPTMDIIGDIEFAKLKDNVWSFAMPGSDVEISVVYRKLMTHNSIKIQNIQAVTYNGEFLKPTFTVKDGTKVLTLDTDYTVEYSNNFNAALATDANAPTLTVTGIGSYAGETTKTFTINKKALTVTAVDTTVVYAGEPAFDVEYNGFVGEETEDVLGGELAYECDYTTESAVGSTFTITPSGLTAQNYNITFATGTLTVVEDLTDAKAALQTAIAIASNINPEGLADAIAAAQTALTAEDATGESLAQATETLEAAIKTYLGEVLPKLGAIVEGLNDETLNAAYADAQAALAKEDVTPQELVAAMQNIITAAQAVAPEHLQNLKGYAEKYGAEEAATLVDNALAAIEAGNVSQIITTMTAVRETATPLATAILTQIIGYAQSYSGFEEDVTAAQAALDGGNYITMITTAKALYAKLMAAANDYVASAKAIPTEGKVGVDELNAAITAAEQALAAQDSDFSAINTAIANLVAAVKAFEEANKTTGVEKIENGKLKIENYYDLNGRKVNGQLKKGVYIVGGHKVVIK